MNVSWVDPACPWFGRRGVFGPILNRLPHGDRCLELWDAAVAFATFDGS